MPSLSEDAAAHALAGRELLGREDYEAAEAAFREAIKLDPERADYQAALGRACLGQRHYEAAERAFGEAVDLQPDSAEYLGGLGEAALGQEHYDDAEAAFQKAVVLRPGFSDYCAGLGDASLGQERFVAAEAAFRDAVGLEPDNADYRAGLDRARVGRARYEAVAKSTVRSIGKTDRDNNGRSAQDGARLGRRRYLSLTPPGEYSYQADLVQAAAEAFAEPTSPGADRAEYHATVGRERLGDRRYGDAEDAFREAARLSPSRADYQAGLGYALLGQGRYGEAATEFRAAVRLAPDRADYLAGLGRARMGQEHYGEAGAAYGEAVRLSPGRSDYLAGLGHARLGQEHYAEAETAFDRAIAHQPDSADSLAGLGHALMGLERHRDAATAFGKAAELQPDSAEHHGSQGQALLPQERYGEAEAAFSRALELQPHRAEYYAGLGQALLGQGQYSAAEAAFREAVNLQPDNANYHAGLGHAQAGQGQYDLAEAAFRQAVAVDSSSLRYRASLGKALLCQNRIQDAQSVLDEAVAMDPGADETISLRQAISEAYDDAVITYIGQLARDELEAGRIEVATIQPDRYLDHVQTLSQQNLSGIREPYREWRIAVWNSERSSRSFIRGALESWRYRLIGAAALLLLTPGIGVAVNEIASAFGRNYVFPALRPESLPISASVALGAVAFLFIFAEQAIKFRQDGPGARPAALLKNRLDALINNIILEPAVTAALRVVWRDPGLDIVTVEDGAELSTKAEPDNIIPTEAYNRLAISLVRRHGAAVGIAGPRGSGKTELARAFTEFRLQRSPTRTIPLMLWAPVKYDAQTFLMRLLKELCISIISAGCGASVGRDPLFALQRRRHIITFALAAAGFITAGVLLILTRFQSLHFRATGPLVVGAMLIAVGLTIAFLERSSRTGRPVRPIRGVPMRRETIDLASELRSRVEFTETYTRGSTIGVSGKNVNATGTTGTQLARIPLNEIDVVREMRNMVETVAKDGWQVVIAIDELDKMSDQAEATEFLNHLKVLFPIHDCSFIVSVSQDAWALFECRGLPLRDALDSSFDEIVLVDRLKPQESRDLLKRRCRDITDAQALLCHCLSGGLPRDLLRAVRLLARIASSLKDSEGKTAPSLSEVLERFFSEDLMAKIAAARGGLVDLSKDLAKMDEDLLILWAESQFSGISAEIQPEPSMIKAYVSFLCTVREAFSVGGPLDRLDEEQGFSHPLITGGFDLIAQARRSLATDIFGSYELLERASRALEIASIRSGLSRDTEDAT